MEFNLRDKTLRLLRAAIATITSYMFFNRGECSACALLVYIVVNKGFVTLLLRHEKGHMGLQPGRTNIRQILVREVPRVASLL